MSNKIAQLAEAYGVAPGYMSEVHEWVETPAATRAKVLAALGVGLDAAGEQPPLPPHDDIQGLAKSAFWPQFLVDTRAWGLAVQAYALRSERNWGIGDFEDLARLAEIAAAFGADFIGVSPLHALFFADPTRISPYSPSTRIFLNPLFIAPDLVKGFDMLPEREALLAELAALRAAELVDYPAVHRVKARALEALFDRFMQIEDAPSREAFARYRREQGAALKTHALYEALAEHFVKQGGSVSWQTWPEAYRDPKSLAARDFARAAKRRVDFHTWLQWIADKQLAEAQARARAAGMRIGLYLDLAVGISPDGSRAWAGGPAIARQARVGCPPDPFSAAGQDWGLVPFSPIGLVEERFEPFRALLRANMRHTGALRIDHAMGLTRLYWIPEGSNARDGAYLRYPFREMLEAVADESWIHRTIVIGEDLGTVPEGFTDIIVRAGLLSYQVLYFAEHGGAMLLPPAYRREALVCASTHDLPTLQGWWTENDIAWRLKTGRATEQAAQAQREQRARDRRRLLQALKDSQVLAEVMEADADLSEMPADMLVAVHRFLAQTPCRLLAVQLDDTLGLREQANLPGTTDEHPNWRRKMAVPLEQLGAQPLFRAVTEAVASERPRG
jgi:4-alpha-glucanotransferase